MRHIYRTFFHVAEFHSRHSRVAKKGKESYGTINGANQEEPESLHSLLFADSHLLSQFTLEEALRRGATRHGVGGHR